MNRTRVPESYANSRASLGDMGRALPRMKRVMGPEERRELLSHVAPFLADTCAGRDRFDLHPIVGRTNLLHEVQVRNN